MKNVCCSACLLGIACRYDGKSKANEDVLALKDQYNLIPVCPEVLGGLATPRTPSEIVGGKVFNKDGIDNTSFFTKGANEALDVFLKNDCAFAILKDGSPSCGVHLVNDGTFSGTKIQGEGICTKLFKKCGIIVYSEEDIRRSK